MTKTAARPAARIAQPNSRKCGFCGLDAETWAAMRCAILSCHSGEALSETGASALSSSKPSPALLNCCAQCSHLEQCSKRRIADFSSTMPATSSSHMSSAGHGSPLLAFGRYLTALIVLSAARHSSISDAQAEHSCKCAIMLMAAVFCCDEPEASRPRISPASISVKCLLLNTTLL